MSHLGEFFRNRRLERGLSLGHRLGYTNVSKGANRIQAFESGGKVAPDLLGKLAEALEIGPDEIRREVYEDYRAWLAWAKEPVRPHVVVRLLAAVYQRVQLPDDALDPEAAEAFAADVARQRRMKVCLVLSRRVSVWYDAEGREYGRTEATPELPCEPFVIVGGKRVQFDFGDGMGLLPIDGRGGELPPRPGKAAESSGADESASPREMPSTHVSHEGAESRRPASRREACSPRARVRKPRRAYAGWLHRSCRRGSG